MTGRQLAASVVFLTGLGCATPPKLPAPLSCSLDRRTTHATPLVQLARPEIVTRGTPAGGALWGPDEDAALVGARFAGEIEGHYPELTACFDRGRERDAELAGRVTIRLTVAPSGDVIALADGGGTTLSHRGVVGCVQSTFTRMKFAPWEGDEVTALLPVDFTAPRELSCVGSRRLGP